MKAALKPLDSVCSVLVAFCLAAAATHSSAQSPADISSNLESIRTQYALPGLTAMAVKGGRIMAQGAAGLRRQGHSTPISITDPVGIASCTKWMTGVVAARLVDRGVITWTTRVRDLLTNYTSFNSAFHDATLEQLLAHRAGVVGGAAWESAHWTALMSQTGSVATIRRWVTETALTDPPGTTPGNYLYSNQGYTVAATMMELASGKSWETLIQEEVFTPLNMTSAFLGISYNNVVPPAGVVGHDLANASSTPVPRSAWSATTLSRYQASNGPGGFTVCTLLDWARFLSIHALDDTGYLQPATLLKVRTPFVGTQGYALGVDAVNRTWATPGRALTHSGDIFGQDSVFWMSPGRDLVVMAFTNTRTADGSAFTALDQAVGLLVSLYSEATPAGPLLDASTAFSFSQSAVSVDESDGSAEITVTRPWPGTAAGAVAYTLTSGTAVHGQDYSGEVQGVINFAPGQISRTLSIPITDDSAWEDMTPETFQVTLGFDTAAPANGFSVSGTNPVTVSILDNDAPPVAITPVSGGNGGILPATVQMVPPGTSITFQAAPDPGYLVMQWSLNGTVVQTGGTSYTLDPVTGAATVSVSFALAPQPPLFVVQPPSNLVYLGSPATLSPVVTGDPVITFQWNKAGKVIPGAVDSSYTIPVTKAADVAAYSVIADNPVGAPVPSSAAYLGLVTLSQGTQTLKAGTTLSLKCTVAAPTAPGISVKYSWRRVGDPAPLANGPLAANGPVVSGADMATLSITKMRAVDSGTYTCLVTLDTPGNDPQLTNGNMQVNVVDAVPVMNPIPLPASVSVSQSLDETVTATNFPTGFTVTGLPKGLKMDPKTGRITGKPTEPSKKDTLGAYIPNKITFKATNPWSTGPALDFFMTIEALDPSVVGTFNGIVARSGHSNFGLGGHVQITVASTGVVSGSATLAGQKHTVAGILDISLGNDPTASLVIKRTPASLGDLQLMMNIVTGNDLLQGRIIEPRFETTTDELVLGDPAEPGLVNGPAEDARFSSPGGIAILPGGSGYIADTGNHVIRFASSATDTVTTLAGNPVAGSADGTGAAAGFNAPEGLALDASGNLYVADTGNSTIRKVTPGGVVTTFAGSAGQTGSTNGTGSAARFDEPCALCFDPAGNLYVVDRGSHLIRKITPAGAVTTLAGKAGTAGHKDGSGTGALLNGPRGITYDPALKALFVTDTQNKVIRKITLGGAVTTYAGSPGVEGYADGLFANARFVEPAGIVSLGNGTLVVGDSLLVQINANGTAAAISDRVDTVNSLDHPVALGFDTSEGSVIAVHDRLHALTSHEGNAPLQNALIEARRSPWTTTNLVPVAQQAMFNAVLETTALPNDPAFPQGEGYVQVSISKNGIATWAGKAADGSTLTFGTFIASDRSIPLHVPLYKNTGSLQGETFITTPDLDLIGDITPALDWYKVPQPLASTDRSYKGGFMLHALELYGGKYVPNNIHSYLGLTSSPDTPGLEFTQSLIGGFTQSFTLTAPNGVVVPSNSRSLGLKIDPKTGIFTGSFKEGSPAVTVPFAGILIHYVNGGNPREGRGHYLPPASSASTAPIQSARVRLGSGT